MKNKDMISKAKEDYEKLKLFLELYAGTFNDLCDELNGFNISEKYFDLNFNSITTTIYNDNNKYILCEYIDIWDDKNCELVVSNININKIKEV